MFVFWAAVFITGLIVSIVCVSLGLEGIWNFMASVVAMIIMSKYLIDEWGDPKKDNSHS
jgi:hypothetical protein